MLDLYREGWLPVARFRRVDGLDTKRRRPGFFSPRGFPREGPLLECIGGIMLDLHGEGWLQVASFRCVDSLDSIVFMRLQRFYGRKTRINK